MRKSDFLVVVRGGGDLATGIIHRLFGAGFRVLVLEAERPAAIRRQVSFCEAVYEGQMSVEGVTAVKIACAEEAKAVWDKGLIPVLTDPEGESIAGMRPDVVVDAIIAKKNLGTGMHMAPLTIGVGPGFVAGEDVHVVVETRRGHNLGRILREGSAFPNTGIPGDIGGYTKERVIHARAAGTIHLCSRIGDIVSPGQEIAVITGADGAKHSVKATIAGILRGLIREGYAVTEGFKIADIDPRQQERKNCFTISDKARCIAGSVLELVCAYAMKQ